MMWQRFNTWLNQTRLTDPLQRQQALIVQRIFVVLLAGAVLSVPILVVAANTPAVQLIATVAMLFGASGYILALVQIRRGFFEQGVLIGIGGLTILVTLFAIPAGVLLTPITAISYMIPLVLVGLLVRWRAMFVILALIIASIVTVTALELPPYQLTGFIKTANAPALVTLAPMVLILIMNTTLLGLFGGAYRTVLRASHEREAVLELLQATLEHTVHERTRSLELALAERAEREANLTQALTDLQASRATIRDLSAPIIPVLPGVLVAPLVGVIDEQRAREFAENLLVGIEQRRASTAIIDVTGVPLVDTHVAQTLIEVASTIRLLGAQTLLVGIRPEVAQTLVSLGVDLSAIPTYADLQEAVMQFMRAGTVSTVHAIKLQPTSAS